MRGAIFAALTLAIGCATAAPSHIQAGEGSLQLELVRYAGRMNVRAWVDDPAEPVLQMRLDRETFALPLQYDLGSRRATEHPELGGEELARAIDADYERTVTIEFERFWKTGPFTTPETIDRVHLLDDRVATPGTHTLQIEVEPDTVSWSVTFRVVRIRKGHEPETLTTLDLDSMMVALGDRRYPLPPVRIVR
jgi:hypothetical protein